MKKFTFVINIIGILLFKFILDLSYIYFVNPKYEYAGFYLDYDSVKYIEGLFVYIFIFLLVYRLRNINTYVILLLSFLLLITPTVSLYAFKNEPSNFFYMIVIPYSIMLLFVFNKRIKLKYVKNSYNLAIIISVIVVFIVLLNYIKTVGVHHINFNLSKVYELRSDFGSLSNSGLFGYLNSWATKVFNIFLISLFLFRKKYLLSFIFLCIQILFFGFSGHKSVLFVLILLVGLYYFDKFKNKTTIVVYSFSIFIIFNLLIYKFANNLLIPSIFIRRVFFVPANLNYVYFDFFTDFNYIYWSNGFLKSFIDYPYDKSIVFVIGESLGYPKLAANVGLFGAGFMQFGIYGIMIYITVVAIMINFINQFAKLDNWLVNTILIMPMLTLFISSDLPTTLLTHGLMVAILLLYLASSLKVKRK